MILSAKICCKVQKAVVIIWYVLNILIIEVNHTCMYHLKSLKPENTKRGLKEDLVF